MRRALVIHAYPPLSPYALLHSRAKKRTFNSPVRRRRSSVIPKPTLSASFIHRPHRDTMVWVAYGRSALYLFIAFQ